MERGSNADILLVSLIIVNYYLELCNLIGHASSTAILVGFSDSTIISPTCSGVPVSNSTNKAKNGTEVASQESSLLSDKDIVVVVS